MGEAKVATFLFVYGQRRVRGEDLYKNV